MAWAEVESLLRAVFRSALSDGGREESVEYPSSVCVGTWTVARRRDLRAARAVIRSRRAAVGFARGCVRPSSSSSSVSG